MRRYRDDLMDELARAHARMDRLMDGWFGPAINFVQAHVVWHPPLDVCETAESFLITVDLAGVDADSLDVRLEDNVVSIRGRRERQPLEAGVTCRLLEINYGLFERILRLPQAIEADSVTAELRDGFLHLTMKKLPKPRTRIPVGE